MHNSFTQGGMNSAISPDERLSLMIPKLYFLYLTPLLNLELWASEVRHYLEISVK